VIGGARAASGVRGAGGRLTVAFLTFGLGWGLAPAVGAGGDERWAVDPAASHADFRARLFAVIPLAGRFEAVEGRIDVDRRRATARIDTVVSLERLAMANAAHRDWALAEAFFDAARHPEARFRADDVPLGVLTQGGIVFGTLALRAIRRPVAFRARPVSCPLVPGTACRLVLEGTLRRSEFGMRAERHAVADRVQLRIEVEGHEMAAGAALPDG
jgi:polyisoprenoid-binding protein YceI